MRVVSLFDYTGVMVQPWLDNGFECLIVDIKHPAGIEQRGKLSIQGADLLTWVPPREWVDTMMMFAFPPCTHLAVSGASSFKAKGLGALIEGLQLVERSRFWGEWFGCRYMIENPVSTISTYWRKPDHLFHPWQYTALCEDDAYTKKTCLWTSDDFIMPFPCPSPEVDGSLGYGIDDERISAHSSTEQRKRTPLGFAKAVYNVNGDDMLSSRTKAR